jgi:hypothetical protein
MPNKADPQNPAITSLFQRAHYARGVCDLRRSAFPALGCVANRHILVKHIVLFLLICGTRVFGQGMVYSFSGHVTDISQDAAGSIRDSGISVGDSLTATFVVDLGRPGFYTQNDGSVVFPSSDPHDVPQYHYYYDQLVSDLPIHMMDGGSFNRPTDAASWNYAYDYYGIAQRNDSMGILRGGGDNAYLSVWKSDLLDATIGTWKVGDSFEANAWASGTDYRYSLLMGSLTLTGISPVPEPSSCLLLGLGAVSLFCNFRRR